jgi:hypothetical protein
MAGFEEVPLMRIGAAVIALSMVLPVHAGIVATGGGPDETDLAFRAVQDGVSRSPEMFLAGTVESTAAPLCRGEGNLRRCSYEATVVRVLASRIVGEGETIRMTGEVEPGKRVLGFFIPSGSGDTWNATFLSFDTGEAKQAQLEKALKMAGLKH